MRRRQHAFKQVAREIEEELAAKEDDRKRDSVPKEKAIVGKSTNNTVNCNPKSSGGGINTTKSRNDNDNGSYCDDEGTPVDRKATTTISSSSSSSGGGPRSRSRDRLGNDNGDNLNNINVREPQHPFDKNNSKATGK